jgi:hypothetical protein
VLYPWRHVETNRDIGKRPPVGAAPNRRQSRILGFWRVIGCGVIVPRRNNIAHLRRPWRATLRLCAILLPISAQPPHQSADGVPP